MAQQLEEFVENVQPIEFLLYKWLEIGDWIRKGKINLTASIGIRYFPSFQEP